MKDTDLHICTSLLDNRDLFFLWVVPDVLIKPARCLLPIQHPVIGGGYTAWPNNSSSVPNDDSPLEPDHQIDVTVMGQQIREMRQPEALLFCGSFRVL